MNEKIFKSNHRRKEYLWNCSWIGLIVLAVAAAEILVWFSEAPTKFFLMVVFVPFIVIGISLQIVQPIEKKIRRTFLKKYWIEDHGDVVKLFGSIRMDDMDYAYRDILSVKPGMKILDETDTFNKYGCTIAAVKAMQPEIQAKQKVEEMGFPVTNIGG